MMKFLLFVFLLIHSTSAQHATGQTPAAPASKKWPTLNGQQPVVVARGGFSGLFPEGSIYGYDMTMSTSLQSVIILCNMQLTKDNVGICQPEVRLDNTTNIADFFPKQTKTYNVNGQNLSGYFALDYTFDQLANVSVVQNIYTRPSVFDGQQPISTVDDIRGVKPFGVWINVPYDAFYAQHKLSAASFIQNDLTLTLISYISSPEIGFLKALSGKLGRPRTKLFFVFLGKNATEPTTNQTYGSLAQNLNTIKEFASGIVVPKEYIWPTNTANYLEAPTTLVADAHKVGLEVFASGFANDFAMSYNYSYDPVAEYLQFINNAQFSVDGVITDFPPTASEAVACFAEFNATRPSKTQPLIITHNGASGVYAGCTDLAYQQAIDDGADIIDCSVQMSSDGVAFCLDSADLTGDTTAMTTFMSRSTTIPEIQKDAGIFSFDLTWSEIQTVQPNLVSPFGNNNGFPRNPASKNKGKFLTLAEFLDLAKTKAVSGVFINIENAAYLASKKGLDIVAAVTTALSNATFDKQATQRVLIQSDDTSVLSKFQNVTAYTRVLYVKDEISDAPRQPVDEIKKYAQAVTLPRFSLVPTTDDGFTKRTTKVVDEMHAANLSAYVSVLRNEYVALAFDYFADPSVELATYTAGLGVDGIITEYPATASRYLRNPCSDLNAKVTYTVLPAEGGSLLSSVAPGSTAPASAPRPALDVADVVDPPLPAVTRVPESPQSPNATASAPKPQSGAIANAANVCLSAVAVVVLSLLSIGY